MAISAPLNGSGLGETLQFTTASTSGSMVLAAAPTVGNSLVCLCAQGLTGGGLQGFSSLTQTGVHWVQVVRTSAACQTEVWIGYVNATASATINFVALSQGATVTLRANFQEYSGLGAYPAYHVSATATATSTSMAPGTTTPSAGYDYLAVVAGRALSGAAQATPSDGFTNLATPNNGHYHAYKVVTAAAGAVNPAWVIASVQWEATMVLFRVATSNAFTTASLALLNALDSATPTSTGRVKVLRDARVVALTATEPGVNVVGGQAHRWNDLRGSLWGAADLIPGAATDANGPSVTGAGTSAALLHFNGAQWMQTSAVGSVYALDGTTGVFDTVACRSTANGGIAGIARDPTATTVPYLYSTAVGGTYAAVTKPTATARTMDTLVGTGATWRMLTAARCNLVNGVQGMNATSSADPTTYAKIGGRVAVPSFGQPFVGELYTSGSNYEVVGREATRFMTGDVVFRLVVTGEMTQADRVLIEAFMVAQFGVTLDNGYRTKIDYGASIVGGYNNSGVKQTNPYPEYALSIVSGTRGSLVTQGVDPVLAAANWGISGRKLAQMTYLVPGLLGMNVDTSRPGRNVIFIGDAATNTLNAGSTDAQTETDLIACCTAIAALGGKVVVNTIPDHSIFYSGGATNPATALSTVGTYAKAYNARLRANYSTYPGCVGLWDLEANAFFTIDKFGNGAGVQNCAVTTYYDAGAAPGHMNNTGYQFIAGLEKTFLDNNDRVLFPISGRRIGGVYRPGR